MRAVFEWLDAHPGFYWLCAIAATLWVVGWCVRGWTGAQQEKPARAEHWVFAGLLLLFLLVWRWPPLVYNLPLNPDESQLVAGAITLNHDPVFWRAVDGNTAGPVNFYALLPLHFLGLPLDYFAARLTGLLLIWGALVACHRMLRAEYGRTVASVGVLPGALFFATVNEGDFLHYSTEHVPLFLLSLGAALLWRAQREIPGGRAPAWLPWIAGGLCAGLLPWSKLQAAPLAATLAAWGAWLVVSQTGLAWPARLRAVAVLAAAAIFPGLLFLGIVLATGQWRHFASSYIQNNLAYVNAGFGLRDVVREFAQKSTMTWVFPAFLVVPLAIVSFAILHNVRRRQRPGALFVAGGLFTAVAAGCVLAPQRSFSHYLLFLVLPLTWWSAAALGEVWREYETRSARRAGIMLFLSLTLGAALGARWQNPAPPLWGELADRWMSPRDEAGYLLHRLHQPGDTLAVWGWHSHLHVEAGLPQAARDAVSEREIDPSPQRDSYYRPRYLADLRLSAPAFFADAVGPAAFRYNDRATQGHEAFPELAEYIRTHYVPLAELPPVRLYMRADLAAARLPTETARAKLLSQARRSLRGLTPAGLVTPANAAWSPLDHRLVQMLLPPAELSWPLYGSERACTIDYGFHPRAYTEGKSNGAEFIVELVAADGLVRQVFYRFLDPVALASDRGPLSARIVLPPYAPGSRLRIRTTPGAQGNDAWDWIYFARLSFTQTDYYLAEQFPGFNRVPSDADAPLSFRLDTPDGALLTMHAPSTVAYTLTGHERHLQFAYGFQEGAYTRGGATDGARFVVELLVPGEPAQILFARLVQPVNSPADRGRLQAEVVVPATNPGARLVLRIEPGESNSWDWTYISSLELQ